MAYVQLRPSRLVEALRLCESQHPQSERLGRRFVGRGVCQSKPGGIMATADPAAATGREDNGEPLNVTRNDEHPDRLIAAA